MSDKIIGSVGIVAGVIGFTPLAMMVTDMMGQHELALSIGNAFMFVMGWK